MPSGADIEKFAGKQIEIFNIKEGITDPATIAYNMYIDENIERNELSWDQLWDAFINDPRVSEVSALAIGGTYNDVMDGTDCRPEIERLIADRDKLPALKHLYLGANDPMKALTGSRFSHSLLKTTAQVGLKTAGVTIVVNPTIQTSHLNPTDAVADPCGASSQSMHS